MVLVVSDWWHGSEIFRPRIDSESATINPRKFFPESESWNRRMSSGVWIRLIGI